MSWYLLILNKYCNQKAICPLKGKKINSTPYWHYHPERGEMKNNQILTRQTLKAAGVLNERSDQHWAERIK